MCLRTDALHRSTQVYVLLPDHRTPGEKLRSLYYLHGYSANPSKILEGFPLERYAEKYHVAIILPDVQKSFYCNLPDGMNYYDYVAKDLPLILEEMLGLSPRPEDRFLSGISMGGYGTLKLALTESGRYAAAAALSPVGDLNLIPNFFGRYAFYDLAEKPVIPPTEDLCALAEHCERRPRLYISIGTEDFLYKSVQPLREKLTGLQYDFTYCQRPGQHDWDFWKDEMEPSFRFLFGR